jgi:hypothetical protein
VDCAALGDDWVCPDHSSCAAVGDCRSGRCAEGVCISCEDGVQNTDESAVDCGGHTCAQCADGAARFGVPRSERLHGRQPLRERRLRALLQRRRRRHRIWRPLRRQHHPATAAVRRTTTASSRIEDSLFLIEISKAINGDAKTEVTPLFKVGVALGTQDNCVALKPSTDDL